MNRPADILRIEACKLCPPDTAYSYATAVDGGNFKGDTGVLMLHHIKYAHPEAVGIDPEEERRKATEAAMRRDPRYMN